MISPRLEAKTASCAGVTPDIRSIVDYYVHTATDYRLVWQDRKNLAFHFGYFDKTTHTHAKSLDNANYTLARLADIRPNMRVLDAGCGTGGSSLWLAEHCDATPVGVALGHAAIAKARKVARLRRLDRKATFCVADYTTLPFPDGSFDVVWALESVCHAPVKAAFYQEAARVLRPGGRLVLAEYMRTRRTQTISEGQMIAAWLAGWAIPDIDTREEHIGAARTAGFMSIQVQDFTPLTRRSLRRLYHRAVAARPLNRLLYAIGVRNAVQYGNVIASHLQYLALQRGLWFYGVLTATRP
jgi:tocopherol O-methyltransferase